MLNSTSRKKIVIAFAFGLINFIIAFALIAFDPNSTLYCITDKGLDFSNYHIFDFFRIWSLSFILALNLILCAMIIGLSKWLYDIVRDEIKEAGSITEFINNILS